MAESWNLNSGFLDTSFVDFDFTVAKIITILPTSYRANYYTLPTVTIEENQPVYQGPPLWQGLYERRVQEDALWVLSSEIQCIVAAVSTSALIPRRSQDPTLPLWCTQAYVPFPVEFPYSKQANY